MNIIPKNINNKWDDFLKKETVKKEIKKIEDFFPNEKDILRFLKNDPEKIKVVIVGMEPYPSSFCENGVIVPEATGRSFEVRSIKSWTDKFKQTSLRNILKAIYRTYYQETISMEELRTKIKTGEFPISPPEKWFNKLEEQGVLFLNASLTVRRYKVNTHTNIWENFVNELILYLQRLNPDTKWCLFGNSARDRVLH